ncbi:hypothetical protein ACGYKD_11470 [Sulfitobacter sp. TB366]|uniref:hypothetical protein n=1 Tax=Sulfitobacter sp. TB366 TaxID=3368580 RepID=UPI0037463AC1
MSDPTITDPPTAPSRSSRSAFVATTNAFLDYTVTLANELIELVPWVRARTDEVAAAAFAALQSEAEAENAAIDAAASATEAADSATLAISGGAAAAGADVHVPNAAYTASNPASAVVSNVDGQTYRCIVSHSGVATDPANDATRWVKISFNGAYGDLTGKPSLGTAATKNTGTTEGTIPLIGVGGKIPGSVVPLPDLGEYAKFYAGSDATIVDYPVGTVLLAFKSYTTPDANQVVYINRSSSSSYEFVFDTVSGSNNLSGTWRARGFTYGYNSGYVYVLAQRVL